MTEKFVPPMKSIAFSTITDIPSRKGGSMRALLISAILLLTGCMSEEETNYILLIHPHHYVHDSMSVRPDIRAQYSAYIDELN